MQEPFRPEILIQVMLLEVIEGSTTLDFSMDSACHVFQIEDNLTSSNLGW